MFTFTLIINFLNMSEFHLTILRNIEHKAIYMPRVINKLKNQIKWKKKTLCVIGVYKMTLEKYGCLFNKKIK